jgi:Ni2+-binding GTPase involved in maturation of urease and hydrogenase
VSPPPAAEPAKDDKPAKPARKEDRARNVAALEKGLAQTRTGWMQRLFAVFTGKKEIDPALLDAIEETLLTGDVGAATTKRLVDGLKARLDRKELADADRVWDALKADSLAILDVGAGPFGGAAPAKPLVILMAGVNGAGKTTTIAKLATRYKEEGRSVLLAAGDTFRAAAVAQLEMWGKRVGVPVHKGKEGAKPGAVVFEAVKRGLDEGFDVVIELVGGAYVEADLRALAPKGRVVVVGLTGGVSADVNLGVLLRKRATVVGTVLRSRPLEEKIAAARALETSIGAWLARGSVKPVVDRVYAITDAAQAHAAMEKNESFGKLLLRVGA